MKYERFDEITLDDGLTLTVVDSVIYNNTTYIYLTNNENEETNYFIVKEIIKDNESYFDDVTEEEFKKVLELIAEKNKDTIKEYLG